MVFARTKMVMEDNCFEEDPGAINMKFVGPNVTKIYEKMYDLIKSVFHVPDSQIQETDYNWGKAKNGEKFKVTWWVHKDMDVFSYMYVRFKLNGQGNSSKGKATLQVKGYLRSEYPQDTVWQRSLFYEMMRSFWHRVFYRKRREEYGEDCRHNMILFQKKMKEIFEELKKGA